MLAAEANAIADEAFASSLSLLEREMQVVLQHLNNLGTQAALIAGFVFVVYADGVTFQGVPPVVSVESATEAVKMTPSGYSPLDIDETIL